MDFLDKGVYRLNLSLVHEKYNPRIPQNLVLDLKEIYGIEARKDELAIVNRERAPELSNTLGRGRSMAAEMFVLVSHITNTVANAMKKREAVIVLDEAPAILTAKGLINARSPGGSADFRIAVVNADPEYLELQDLYEQLRGFRGLIQIKMEGLEKHFYAVQNIYKPDKAFGLEESHRDLSGHSRGADYNRADTTTDEGFIGTPRY